MRMMRSSQPGPQGLYYPRFEHDACGVSFVVDIKGRARAHYLLARLLERTRDKGVAVPTLVQTDYINTIPPSEEP